MNQILQFEKPKKNNTLEIKTIVMIFAIAIIILGAVLIGKGTYGMITSANAGELQEPVVSTKEVDGKLQLNITHDKAIDSVTYSWNGKNKVVLKGKGLTSIVETIEYPEGTNTLSLEIKDISKKIAKFTKQYYKEDIDTVKPEIEFIVEGSKAKISVKDETELSYIMYRWNEEDNTIVEVREDSKQLIEEKISILKGENTLTVVAVDAAGNEAEKEQVFKGVKKPTIELTQENDELVIRVQDEENIKKIDFTLNGTLYSTDPENTGASLNMPEVQLRQKLEPGENTINITVYSVSGLSEQVTKQITI